MLRPIKLENVNTEIKSTYPGDSALIEGRPLRTSRPLLSESVQLMRASEWTSEAGSWTFERPLDSVEIFHVISGRCRVTAPDDTGVTFGPGDSGVLPAGFKGAFIVMEEVRKIAFIVSPTDEFIKSLAQ